MCGALLGWPGKCEAPAGGGRRARVWVVEGEYVPSFGRSQGKKAYKECAGRGGAYPARPSACTGAGGDEPRPYRSVSSLSCNCRGVTILDRKSTRLNSSH